MTVIVAIVVMAVLFGVFTVLRPRDRDDACAGNCAGCTHDRACASRSVPGEQL